MYTGGSERLRIDTSGNVGIGTSSASSRLTIDGGSTEIRSGNALLFRPSGNGNDNRFVALTANGLDVVWGGAPTTSVMHWANGGNVGIGTSSPNNKLDIVAGTLPSMQIQSSKTNSTAKYSLISSGHYTSATYPVGFNMIGGEATSTANNAYIGGYFGEATAATQIAFYTAANNTTTAGTERMRIDSNGSVYIAGTSLAVLGYEKLNVLGSAGIKSAQSNALGIWNTASVGLIQFYTEAGGTNAGGIGATGGALTLTSGTSLTLNAPGSNLMAFQTNSTERMRIDTSGNLLVGTTTARAQISNDFNGSTNNGIALNDTASASGTAYAGFYVNGSAIGSITRVGATSAVVYNTTSDQRLKSNIADANPVLDKLMTVKVRQYDWTEGDLHQDAGFIAQELAPVLSGIVTEGKTAKDMWQVDYSRLTPYLVKAVQELKAELDSVKAELQTLKGN
jgi:hypothetical protein